MRLFPALLVATIAAFAAPASLVFPFEVNANAALTVYHLDTGIIVYFAEAVIPAGADLSEIATKRDEMEVWLGSESRGDLKLPIDDPNAKIVVDENGKEETFHYKVDFRSGNSETLVQFELTFANLYSFYKFNRTHVPDAPKTTVKVHDPELFVIWRTTTLPNPYLRFFLDSNTNNIMKRFNDDFNGGRIVTENFYVFSTSTRRTETNADETDTSLLTYDYYYRINPANQKDVIIRDRFANTWVWYALAVVATAVAMLIFYFIAKELEKRKIARIITNTTSDSSEALLFTREE